MSAEQMPSPRSGEPSYEGKWKMRWDPPGDDWTRARGFYWPRTDRPPTVADAVAILQFADVVRADD